ncbi:MAG TPA: glycosyltransferase family 2 protein [Rhabdochlamydiaceae bacterium]|jgi:glycosyltransferase involved in cell wall biosynthesis
MISVTILTKNNQQTLKATLESVKSFSEVLVYDTGSTDDTLLIAESFPNVVIFQGPFEGFGRTHNTASSLAARDWILSLDSDEVLSPSLALEIQTLALDTNCVYELSRNNFYNEKWIKWCGGWYPDSVARLYHRKVTRFSDDAVHEKILSEGLRKVRLSSPLSHVPYRSVEDFLKKMQMYTSLFADQYPGKSASLGKAILHGWFAFFKSYVLKRGFLGGKEGYIISAYNGHTTYYKYLKVLEKHTKH